MDFEPALKRSLSLPLITLYGVGTTVGAGIYVLIGKVAGMAGMTAPISFLLASLMVAFSAFSFAELASRHPFSAGEALYVQKGFGLPRLATVVGLLVVFAAVVSSATICLGFVGYFQRLLILPDWLILILLVALLGALAAWGIAESVSAAAVVTLIEVGGLLVVVGGGANNLADFPRRLPEMLPGSDLAGLIGIVSGAVLAFYAFIGFEDMVNVAEEVNDVERIMPRAIILTLVVTTVVYMAVAIVAVLSIPIHDLAQSDAPIALLFERTTGANATWISAIAVIAVVNGALIQIIMGSRVLYGLSRQRMLPALFGRVHKRTRTPMVATLIMSALILALALLFPVVGLAKTTSYATLTIFALVNAALWRIKRRGDEPHPVFQVPAWVPGTGAAVSVSVLIFEAIRVLAVSGQ